MRILIVTPLDYHRADNNREHNMVRHFSRLSCSITVLYKAMNRSPGFLDMLSDTCTFRIRRSLEEHASFIRVDPFVNYYAGLRAQCEAGALGRPSTFSMRHLLVRIFSQAAFLRDVCTVPCLLLAGLFYARGRFDACIGFGPWGGLTGWLLKRLGKAGIFLYEDRDYEPGLVPDRFRRSYTAWVERKAMLNADLIVSLGYRLAALRKAQTGREIVIIPTGVEWQRFLISREARKRQRHLVYLGNLISWSGLDLAINAMSTVRARYPDAKLVIVGDGLPTYVEYLQRLARERGVEDTVEFRGRIPNERLPSLLANVRIGLANSQPVDYRKFAYPLKVIEYMAAGLPVIGTKGTETEDIISRARCGISVAFDEKELAEAIIRLFDDDALYAALRENGIRESATMTWSNLMDQELALLRQCLSEKVALQAGNQG